jgi:hypothetical protein
MPITYDIDFHLGVLTLELLGDVRFEDFARYFAMTEADPRFRSDLKRLVVMSDVTSLPGPAELRRLSDELRSERAKGARFAVVAETPLVIGVSRMIFGQAGLFKEVELFPDRTSALRWLVEQKPAAAPSGASSSSASSRGA